MLEAEYPMTKEENITPEKKVNMIFPNITEKSWTLNVDVLNFKLCFQDGLNQISILISSEENKGINSITLNTGIYKYIP